ncbi:MAG: cysteine desulfurase, partial [Deltaproteobacteria bacterium]|nr:cysteine desulfurase [Deltaproteobacteria bacterium]
MHPIYLDYNATTPIDPEAAAAMQPCLDDLFGNPSSSHMAGFQAKKAVDEARKHVAGLIGAKPEEIVFTSGGTESNNHALKGIASAYRPRGRHIITSAIEHPAVTEVCHYLEKQGFSVTYLPVNEEGLVSVAGVEKAITTGTILISIMHANNEVGTIQPIAEIAAIAARRAIIFHTDAAQTIGKIPVDVGELGVDLLSIAGHKLYAPKGIGALYIREGTVIEKFMHGAGHELDRRAGTENLPGIVGLGAAFAVAKRDLSENRDRMGKTRDLLFDLLQEKIPDIRLNGHLERRLPNTLSIGFRGIDATALVGDLASKDIAVSAGAACHAGVTTLSPTLAAMRVPIEYAQGTIRFSIGKATTREEIEQAATAVAES